MERLMANQTTVSVVRRVHQLSTLLFALVVLAACSSTKYPAAPAVAATPDSKYLIGPLDTLNIIVWRNPELSLTVAVRPDGRISTPLVEDLEAQGRNPTDLARAVEKAQSKYMHDPVEYVKELTL